MRSTFQQIKELNRRVQARKIQEKNQYLKRLEQILIQESEARAMIEQQYARAHREQWIVRPGETEVVPEGSAKGYLCIRAFYSLDQDGQYKVEIGTMETMIRNKDREIEVVYDCPFAQDVLQLTSYCVVFDGWADLIKRQLNRDFYIACAREHVVGIDNYIMLSLPVTVSRMN